MKKLLTLLSMLTLVITAAVCFNASAAEERVVIDNVVYELKNQFYSTDLGEHYTVTDFFDDETLAETTTKINIVDEIDGIEVLVINTNFNDSDSENPSALYRQKYPNVTKISVPSTVKYIGEFAFNFFPSVEKLVIPSEVEYIGDGAFSEMESLKEFTVSSGITTLRAGTFKGCKSLEKVTAKVVSVGTYAFYGCENLETVDAKITSVYDHAFDNCVKLTSINWESIEHIGDYAFRNTGFEKVILAENLKLSATEGIFDSCKNIEKIVYEDTSANRDEKIDIDAYSNFYKCTNVKGIYIKTIPAKNIYFTVVVKDENYLPNLEKIYFAGSEKLWNKLVSEKDRQELEEIGVEIVFYYKHTHSFTRNGNPTCTKGGKFTYSCECGDTQTVTLAKDPDNHSYGSWKVTKKATYAATGTKQRTCKYCKKVQKATIKKLVLGEIENLTATVDGNEVVLNWDALEGATGYRVYIYDKEQNKNIRLASIKGKITYTVSDLEAGETYTFIIQPYNKTSSGTVTWGEMYNISAEIPAEETQANTNTETTV